MAQNNRGSIPIGIAVTGLAALSLVGCSEQETGPVASSTPAQRRAEQKTPTPPVPAVNRDSVYGIDEVTPASLEARPVSLPATDGIPLPEPQTRVSTPVEQTAGTAGVSLPDLGLSAGDGGDHLAQGQRFYAQRSFGEAAAHLKVFTEERPEHAYAAYLLGLSLWKHGDRPAAADALRTSTTLNPDFGKAHINLSRVLNEMGEYEQALESATAAVDLDPTSSDALHLQGRSLANLGRGDEAVTALRASIVQDPDNGHARNRLGLLFIHQGRFDAAVAELEVATDLLPQIAYVRNNLGLAYERTGRTQEAALQYAAGVELSPGNSRLVANLERMGGAPPAEEALLTADAGTDTPVEEPAGASGR